MMPNDIPPIFPENSTPTIQQTNGDPASAAAVAARENVAAQISNPPVSRGRGRPPKNAGTGTGNNTPLSKEIDKALREQLNAVYDPKAWGALLAAPGDVALAITGKDRWKINDNERETLGVTGSAAARTMMITNPRSLALFMVGTALFSVYLPRLSAELRDQYEAKKKNEEKK